MHLLQEVSFPAALGITDGGGIGGFCDEEVWATFVNPGCTKMSIWGHVVVTLIKQSVTVQPYFRHHNVNFKSKMWHY